MAQTIDTRPISMIIHPTGSSVFIWCFAIRRIEVAQHAHQHGKRFLPMMRLPGNSLASYNTSVILEDLRPSWRVETERVTRKLLTEPRNIINSGRYNGSIFCESLVKAIKIWKGQQGLSGPLRIDGRQTAISHSARV